MCRSGSGVQPVEHVFTDDLARWDLAWLGEWARTHLVQHRTVVWPRPQNASRKGKFLFIFFIYFGAIFYIPGDIKILNTFKYIIPFYGLEQRVPCVWIR